ncbi:radical SAM/SPASM domain-containing protein [Hydrogenimonas thermophila]|uniref:Radical SAM additional 4Fe4S-binding SPASM domain-containing protein n=1 Tax=Hydrogenimonas thermophila TaxID=223786 RepID=A0A1I5L3C5_9BACT|nr:radical SAM protein [Hydrogenimonas thermophila]WOE70029.1 radical SAM protein [Hydrogenimonas thermophila]WOE72546.1 radical SAM protein [Hydrogenimonas thermophila]SFO91662.1 radical SAM additional 4Fe4S-binding SPASM domain-containing protein [Hydrogenimonas thermophila]
MYKIEDINYMVSLYCPGKCVNCNIWQYDKKEIIKDELDINIFEKIFSAKAIQHTNYFDLTAGESQLSPKYIDVVKIIAKNKPNAFIHTNISGWYPQKHYEVTKECLKYIKKENFRIDISLDGKKENYEKIRLVKNGYEKVLETIELLKPFGINLRVTMIVYKQNYNDILWFIDFAKKNQIEYFIGYARNANLLNNLNKQITYSKEELQFIEELLYKANWLNDRRKPNWLWAKSIYENSVPYFNCYMGKKAIVIDPYGNVYPCNDCLDFLNMGNLNDFDGNLDNLLTSKKALNVIKTVENKKCQPCGMLCAHKIEFPWGKQAGLQ